MKMNKHVFLFIIMLLIVGACKQKNRLLGPPQQLKTEYQENPIHIDESPTFSWVYNDKNRGASQGAYQILVASSEENLSDEENADIWNSGKVQSDQSVHISYEGVALESDTRYYWTVKTWDQEDNDSEFSDPAWFETGLMKNMDWQADWIGDGSIAKPPRSIALRKEFNINKPVAHAKVYVSGLGNYVLFLNGQKVGNDKLTPGWTHYPHKIQYQSYDVSQMLNEGPNAAGAYLGNMWWSSGLGWKGGVTYSDGPLHFIMQMHVTYEDETTEIIKSDNSWKTDLSPIVENELYDGETYDANLEQPGWDKPNFNDNAWSNVEVIPVPDSILLVAQEASTIQVTQELVPVAINEVNPGIFVFDLGQNMVGTARLRVKGEQGDEIVMKFAELIHPDGTVAQENLRSANVDDRYILKGTGEEEIYEPFFTYHGFRYVQVEGLDYKPDKEAITGLVFHTNAEMAGKFNSSNELLNSVYNNILWGQRGNLMSVPTDCPQRDERLGWMGDAQVFAATANYNMNLPNFWHKWQRDILDCQEPEGWVYDVNPAIVVGGPSKPGWGDAVVIVPWENYRFYGDLKIVDESYDGMKAWVDYMENNSEDYIYEWGDEEFGGYGDWVAVEKTPSKPIGAAYFFYSSKLLSQMAGVLGKSEDQAYYQELCEKIAPAYQNKYFDPQSGQYEGQTQTANLLPVAFGITPDDLKEQVVEKVVANVRDRGNHLTTGFLGTKYLLPILSDYGYHDLAYEVATQRDYPSWGYMVEKGATTMWELWNSDTERPEGMNSRNHFAFGVVGEWYFGYLAGIKPVFEHPGFKKSIIAPKPVGDLSFAQASQETVYGSLAVRWQKNDTGLELDVTIPNNTSATVKVPKLGEEKVQITEATENIYTNSEFTAKQGIRFISENEDEVIFEVGSGNYLFQTSAE